MLGALPKGGHKLLQRGPAPSPVGSVALSSASLILYLTAALSPPRLRFRKVGLPAFSSGEERNSQVLHPPPTPTGPCPIHIQKTGGQASPPPQAYSQSLIALMLSGLLPRLEHHRPPGLKASAPLMQAHWA